MKKAQIKNIKLPRVYNSEKPIIENVVNYAAIGLVIYFGKQAYLKHRAKRILEKYGNTPEVQNAVALREALRIDGFNLRGPDEKILYSIAAKIHNEKNWQFTQTQYRKIYNSQLTTDLKKLSPAEYKAFIDVLNGAPLASSNKEQKNASTKGVPFTFNKWQKVYAAAANIPLYKNGKKALNVTKKGAYIGRVADWVKYTDSKGIIWNVLIIDKVPGQTPETKYSVYEKNVYALTTIGKRQILPKGSIIAGIGNVKKKVSPINSIFDSSNQQATPNRPGAAFYR